MQWCAANSFSYIRWHAPASEEHDAGHDGDSHDGSLGSRRGKNWPQVLNCWLFLPPLENNKKKKTCGLIATCF